MSKLDDLKSLTDQYFDEIDATLHVRHSYNSVIVGLSADIFGAVSENRTAKEALSLALKYKSTDPSVLYRSLFVQIHSIFEHYIQNLTAIVIHDQFGSLEKFGDVSDDFRKEYFFHAAKLLTYIKSGNVKGVAYNFDALISNFGEVISNQVKYKLNPEVFTKLMGNCTPDRLESLFKSLMLPEPFSDRLGSNLAVKKYFADSAKGRVSSRCRERLSKEIDLRNEIIHGGLTRAISLGELNDGLSYFRALVAGLTELVEKTK